MRFIYAVCVVVVPLLLPGCGGEPAQVGAAAARAPAEARADESRRLTEFLDAEFDRYLALNPDLALGLGLKVHAGEISDRSEAGNAKILAWRRDSVARMQAAFDPMQLDEVARAAFDVWRFELEMHERQAEFPRHPYWFGGIGSSHTRYPDLLMTFQRIDDLADVDAYVARLSGIGRAIDQLRARTEAAAAEGIRMPRFQYEKTIDSCRGLMTGAPFSGDGDDSALWSDAKTKIGRLTAQGRASTDQASAAAARVREALQHDLAPAYQRLIDWLTGDVDNAPVSRVGVGRLPNGTAWYEAALFLNTTTRLTAEEIHRTGLSEVARIRAAMDAVKARTGFTGSMQAFFDHLRSDGRFFLPNTDAGRAEYITMAQRSFDGMKTRLPDYFGRLPKADVVVRREPSYSEEAGGAAHYTPPTSDGSTPGYYYVHLADMRAVPLWALEATAYHEGIPGHHLQLAIARELTGVPRLLGGAVFYNAFMEGWALYAEPLAGEMGFYQDPYADFGRLVNEQWRAVRLVVDTGLHVKGWTEDEAVGYFVDNTPMPEAVARSEIERYLTTPGQATGYKIGMLTIERLRDEAKAALGSRFDYRQFHDVVLGVGAVPLPVLERRVDAWIARGGA